MTTFIQSSSILNTLTGPSSTTRDNRPQEEALSSKAARPKLNIPKSYKPDPEVIIQFDINTIITEVLSLEVFQGFRFLYYPRSNRNLNKPIHIQFYSQRLYMYYYIRFKEVIHTQDLKIYITFPFILLVKETFLTKDQYALQINKVILPSLQSILPPISIQYFPTTQAIKASKIRTKYNKHQTQDINNTNVIHYPIKEAFILSL